MHCLQTGITLQETGIRDGHGSEPVSGIFSSSRGLSRHDGDGTLTGDRTLTIEGEGRQYGGGSQGYPDRQLVGATGSALAERDGTREKPKQDVIRTVLVSAEKRSSSEMVTPRASPPTYLNARDTKSHGVYVQNLTDEPVKSYDDILRLIKMSDLNRTTASTKINNTSSRSHAVSTLTLKHILNDVATDWTIERLARMRLVDLAGSEATRWKLKQDG